MSLNDPFTLATAIKNPQLLQTAEVSCEPIKILYEIPERPPRAGESQSYGRLGLSLSPFTRSDHHDLELEIATVSLDNLECFSEQKKTKLEITQ